MYPYPQPLRTHRCHQFWLYFWGSCFALLVAFSWDGQITHLAPHTIIHTAEGVQHTMRQQITYHVAVIVTTAVVGLITANILRKRDNLIKLVGAAVCVVTILIAQVSLFPELLSVSLTPFVCIGLGLITVGAWIYNHVVSTSSVNNGKSVMLSSEEGKGLLSRDDGDDGAIALVDMTENEMGMSSKANMDKKLSERNPQTPLPSTASWTTPNTPKIVIVLSSWILLAIGVWLSESRNLSYTSHVDSARFFEPLDLKPSVWGAGLEAHDGYCISNWVKDQDVTPRSHKLVDVEMAHPQNSTCPIYPVPDGGLIFHVFYSGPNRPFHAVVIDAFLATQRLEDGHRLIYWLGKDTTASWQHEISRYEQYSKYVAFREFDPVVEARGTCLEGMPEYYDEEYRKEREMPLVAWSDLVRVLLLSKYGGVWLDSDSLLLRDLTPL
jgi:hypothetical protein